MTAKSSNGEAAGRGFTRALKIRVPVSTTFMCSPTVCDNHIALTVDAPALLIAPTSSMRAARGLAGAALESAVKGWAAGRAFTDREGRCLYGHTDVANANRTETIAFFATQYAAGACVPLSSCHWELEHFLCACVSASKVTAARAILAHHSRHHLQVAGLTLLGMAGVWALGMRALSARRCHPAPCTLSALGVYLLVRARHTPTDVVHDQEYWIGCGGVSS